MCITRAESDKQIFRWERSRLEVQIFRSLGQERSRGVDQICSRGAKKKNLSRGANESDRGADIAQEYCRGEDKGSSTQNQLMAGP